MTDTTIGKGEAKRLSDAELDDLERLHREATEGPWQVCSHAPTLVTACVEDGDDYHSPMVAGTDQEVPEREQNARLIAAARNALPALIGMAREQGQCDVFLKAEYRRFQQAADAAIARAEKAEAERDYYKRRDERIAKLLNAPDGGQYINDMLARVEDLLKERDALKQQVERYDRLWLDHDWERMQQFSRARGGEPGDNIIKITLDAAERAEAERDALKARVEVLTRKHEANLASAGDVVEAVEEVINRLDGGEASLEDVVFETLTAVDWWSLKERAALSTPVEQQETSHD